VIYPDNLDDLCCGMPFQSKGMFEAADSKAKQTEAALLAASNDGQHPIYSDTSPCTLRMKESVDPRLQIFEPIQFIQQFALEQLQITPVTEPIALHITCSSSRMGLAEGLVKLAKTCAQEVIIPDQITCCGFAGDKGFSTPELNESALRTLKDSLPENCHEGFSTSRTCEIGLSYHSGIEYKSIVYLVERCSTPRDNSPIANHNKEQD
ncbi:MAG: (Fe-S)-binding protein, partial [Halopseudomonas sp.]